MIRRLKKVLKVLTEAEKKHPVISKNELLQAERVKPWFEMNGDFTLRLEYDLNEDSVVFDVGGYKGEFASDLFCKYACFIYVFEPIEEFYSSIKNKFSNNKKIKTYNFGLSNDDIQIDISFSDNSSSAYINTDRKEKVYLRSVEKFIKQSGIQKIDLIKINIEGGEYDLLEQLIQSEMIKMFFNIQVQFHDFIVENAKERMKKIQDKLSETHSITYQFEFVWENWTLKK